MADDGGGAGGEQEQLEFTPDTVLEQLQVVFTTRSNEARRRAHVFLKHFVHSEDAWTVADQMLRGANDVAGGDAMLRERVAHFGATALTTKLAHAFHELPADAHDDLRQSLFEHVHTYAGGPRTVRNQLSLGVAMLAVQMPTWTDTIVNDIVSLLPSTDGPGMLASQLGALGELPHVLGGHRVDIAPERRHALWQVIGAAAVDVVRHLATCLEACGDDADVQRLVLVCFHNWLRYARLPTDTDALLDNPLVSACFQALASDTLFEPAVECCVELIGRARVDQSHGAALANEVVPLALALKPTDEPLCPDDEKEAVGHAQIFTALGRRFMGTILDCGDEAMIIVGALLDLARHESVNVLVASTSFWARLADRLRVEKMEIPVIVDPAADDDAAAAGATEPRTQLVEVPAIRNPETGVREPMDDEQRAELDNRREFFAQPFAALLDVVRTHMEYPDDWESWPTDLKEQFRDVRSTWMVDCLRAIGHVLGTEALLDQICDLLEQQLGQLSDDANAAAAEVASGGGDERAQAAAGTAAAAAHSRSIEALLYCCRSVARTLDQRRSALPGRVFALLDQVPTSLDDRLQYTSLLLIGRYAPFLNRNPELLSSSFTVVLEALSYASLAAPPDGDDLVALANYRTAVTNREAATHAFKHVCQQCAPHIATNVGPLLELCDTVSALPLVTTSAAISTGASYAGGVLAVDDALEFYAGVAAVIRRMPTCANSGDADADGVMIEAAQRVCAPFIAQLQDEQRLANEPETVIDIVKVLTAFFENAHYVHDDAALAAQRAAAAAAADDDDYVAVADDDDGDEDAYAYGDEAGAERARDRRLQRWGNRLARREPLTREAMEVRKAAADAAVPFPVFSVWVQVWEVLYELLSGVAQGAADDAGDGGDHDDDGSEQRHARRRRRQRRSLAQLIFEECNRCCRRAIVSYRREFAHDGGAHATALVGQLLGLFETRPSGQCLHTASRIIDELSVIARDMRGSAEGGDYEEYDALARYVLDMCAQFAQRCVAVLDTPAAISELPSVVEGFYDVGGLALGNFPDEFVASELHEVYFEHAMNVLGSSKEVGTDGVRAALQYLRTLVRTGLPSRHNDDVSGRTREAINTTVVSALNHYVACLLLIIANVLPDRSLHYVIDTFVLLRRLDDAATRDALGTALSTSLPNLGDAHKQAMLDGVLSGDPFEHSAYECVEPVVHHFFSACKRRARWID